MAWGQSDSAALKENDSGTPPAARCSARWRLGPKSAAIDGEAAILGSPMRAGGTILQRERALLERTTCPRAGRVQHREIQLMHALLGAHILSFHFLTLGNPLQKSGHSGVEGRPVHGDDFLEGSIIHN